MTRAIDTRARTFTPADAARFSTRSVDRTTWAGTRAQGERPYGAVVIEKGAKETRRRGFGLLGARQVEGTRYTAVIGGDAAQLLAAVRETGELPADARVAGIVFVAADASPRKKQGAYYEAAGIVIDRSI